MTNSMAGFTKSAFFLVIILLSAATSFLFFVEVFQFGRGFIIDPFWGAILTGVIGVIVLDGAALAWLKIYLGAADNNNVRALAAIGAAIGVIGSAVSSFAYLVMVAAEGYQPGSDVRTYVQVAMATIIVAHFLLVFLSGYMATSAKIDEKVAEMMSEATDEMLTLTDQYFKAQIPRLAQNNAQRLTRELAGRFTSLTVYDQPALDDGAHDASRYDETAAPAPTPAPVPVGQGTASINGHRPGDANFP
jgi:hypothetical protein